MGAAEESVTIIPAVLPLSRSFSSSNSIMATESSYHNQSLMQPAVLAQRYFFNGADVEALRKSWGAYLRQASMRLLVYQALSVLFGLQEFVTKRVQPLVKPKVPPSILTHHHLFPFSPSRARWLFQTFPLIRERR